MNANTFGFNGQEKDDEVAGAGNITTAIFWEYDARLGRRWNMDPVFRENPWISPYHTFSNNPILNIDPLGDDDSPIFDKNGNLLGTDDQGMSGSIIVANDPSKFKQGMKHSDALKLGTEFSNDRTDMTMEAKVKTITKVLEGTELPDKTILKPTDFKLTLNEDPNGLGEYNFDMATEKHVINIDLKEKWTVEDVRLVGGVHEYYGHGIKRWGDRFLGGGSHHKIYEAQMHSKYWAKSTTAMKKHIVNQYYRYYYWETGSRIIPKHNEKKYWQYR